MNVALHQELAKVSLRYRRLLLRTALATCWLVLAAAGVAALAWARGAGRAVPGALLVVLLLVPVLVLPLLLAALRRARDPLWVARRIERRFPDLDARLLAALEEGRGEDARAGGFLRETVVLESLEHASRHDWQGLVPAGALTRRALRVQPEPGQVVA